MNFMAPFSALRHGGVNDPACLPAWERPVSKKVASAVPSGPEFLFLRAGLLHEYLPASASTGPTVVRESVGNSWRAASVLNPPGYVRRSEDRFCEPRSRRLDRLCIKEVCCDRWPVRVVPRGWFHPWVVRQQIQQLLGCDVAASAASLAISFHPAWWVRRHSGCSGERTAAFWRQKGQVLAAERKMLEGDIRVSVLYSVVHHNEQVEHCL